MNLLTNCKIRLGLPQNDESKDPLLVLLIRDAENYFRDYCKRQDIPSTAQGIVEQLVVVQFQDRGNIRSESVGDYSVAFSEEKVSVDLKVQLNRYRKTVIR